MITDLILNFVIEYLFWYLKMFTGIISMKREKYINSIPNPSSEINRKIVFVTKVRTGTLLSRNCVET